MSNLRGPLPQLEKQQAHEEFVQAARPDAVLMKMNHARRFVPERRPVIEKWRPLSEFLPEGTDLMTTTTIADNDLDMLKWDHEFDYVRDLNPRWHVPTDYSDYVSFPQDKRAKRIQRSMQGTAWMQHGIELVNAIHRLANELGHTPSKEDMAEWGDRPLSEFLVDEGDEEEGRFNSWHAALRKARLSPGEPYQGNGTAIKTDIVPLLKGTTEVEREICYTTYDTLDVDTVAAYVARYFSAGNGNNINKLIEDLQEVEDERPDLNVVVIGLMSPNYLDRLPDNVIAASGLRTWREEIKPRKRSPGEINLQWQWMSEDIRSGLSIEEESTPVDATPTGTSPAASGGVADD